MSALLEARDVRVRLGGRFVIDGVDVALHSGSLTAVLGENGSGKSTLIRALAGIATIESGSVRVQGDALESLRPRERARRVACTLQDVPLAFDFDLIEVVRMGVQPDESSSVRDRRVAVALESLGIAELAHRSWRRLSGGERQRAHLARLFVSQAPVMMLDEPGNHLDLASRVTLRRLLSERAEDGQGVLFATHDLADAAWVDTVLVLSGGELVASGPPSSVLTPALIERVFRVSAAPLIDPGGGPPAFRIGPLTSPTPRRSAPGASSSDSGNRRTSC